MRNLKYDEQKNAIKFKKEFLPFKIFVPDCFKEHNEYYDHSHIGKYYYIGNIMHDISCHYLRLMGVIIKEYI